MASVEYVRKMETVSCLLVGQRVLFTAVLAPFRSPALLCLLSGVPVVVPPSPFLLLLSSSVLVVVIGAGHVHISFIFSYPAAGNEQEYT